MVFVFVQEDRWSLYTKTNSIYSRWVVWQW